MNLLEDTRPTVCNKPAGVVDNWPQVLAKGGPSNHRSWSSTLITLTPLSSIRAWSSTPTMFTPSPSSQVVPSIPFSWKMLDTGSFDSITMSDAAAPFPNQQPPPFHVTAQNQQFSDLFQQTPAVSVVSDVPIKPCSFLRKVQNGKPPGLRNLPPTIQPTFRKMFIHSVRTTSAEGSSGEGLRRDAQNTSQARARE